MPIITKTNRVLTLMSLYHLAGHVWKRSKKPISRYLVYKPGYGTATTKINKQNKKAKTKDLHLHADLIIYGPQRCAPVLYMYIPCFQPSRRSLCGVPAVWRKSTCTPPCGVTTKLWIPRLSLQVYVQMESGLQVWKRLSFDLRHQSEQCDWLRIWAMWLAKNLI